MLVDAACFRMYYHMYGTDIGSLALFLRAADGHEQHLWHETYNQYDSWHVVNIDLPASTVVRTHFYNTLKS